MVVGGVGAGGEDAAVLWRVVGLCAAKAVHGDALRRGVLVGEFLLRLLRWVVYLSVFFKSMMLRGTWKLGCVITADFIKQSSNH